MSRKKGIKNGMTTKIIKSCQVCDKSFFINPSRPVGKFCSNECRAKSMIGSSGHWTGKKRAEITGEKHPRWRGGKETYNERFRNEYYPRHKHRISLYHKARRFRAGGKLSVSTLIRLREDNIFQYGKLTCYLCLRQIKRGTENVEHKVPISRGGTNDYANLAMSCHSCNSKKKTLTESEYRRSNVCRGPHV